MISHIVGILDQIDLNSITVDVAGIGYKIFATTALINEIGSIGDKVKVYTEQIVREDSNSLYGFRSKEERNLFNALLSVSGIGPKSAMSIISGLPLEKLISAISQGDATLLSSIQGVGSKTAQRIIIELKEKIGKTYGIKPSEIGKGISGDTTMISDAISALITLGYSPREARDAIMKLNIENAKSVEEIIKLALKNLI
ncbi:Holliday junction branch migration protein RuvA [Candidatus Saganbacteria bacterium]|nr:Holliday junction branch migration protein RuvA [Candidatus Saganbacteria bacterium]